MSALRPQSLVCTRRVSSTAISSPRMTPAQVDEQRDRVGVGPTVEDVTERVIEAAEEQHARRREWCQREVGSWWCLPEQVEDLAVLGDGHGDALVDRRVAVELVSAEPAPQVPEVRGGVAHDGDATSDR